MWIATTASSANIYICFIYLFFSPPLDLNLREAFYKILQQALWFHDTYFAKAVLGCSLCKVQICWTWPWAVKDFRWCCQSLLPTWTERGMDRRGGKHDTLALLQVSNIQQNTVKIPFAETIFGSFSRYEGGRLALALKGGNALRGLRSTRVRFEPKSARRHVLRKALILSLTYCCQ